MAESDPPEVSPPKRSKRARKNMAESDRQDISPPKESKRARRKNSSESDPPDISPPKDHKRARKNPSRFASPIFRILAGADEEVLYVNASILSKSPVFAEMVEGKWKESRTAVIKLPDHDYETVARLLDWLVEADYKSPYPYENSNMLVDCDEALLSQEDAYRLSGNGADKGSDDETTADQEATAPPVDTSLIPASLTNTQEAFRDYQPLVTECKETEARKHQRWANDYRSIEKLEAAGYDFGSTLMSHAKLYILADFLLLHVLKDLCIERLKMELEFMDRFHFAINEKGASLMKAIAEVAKLIYDHTSRFESLQEPMQTFIASFTAWKILDFPAAGLTSLMDVGLTFLIDVMGFMRTINERAERCLEREYERRGKVKEALEQHHCKKDHRLQHVINML